MNLMRLVALLLIPIGAGIVVISVDSKGNSESEIGSFWILPIVVGCLIAIAGIGAVITDLTRR